MVKVMDRNSTHLNTEEDTREGSREAFIDLAYRLILGRSADAAGKADYKSALAAGLPPVELLRTLLDSDEYKQKNVAYDYTADPDIAPFLTSALDQLSAGLQACDEVERS